MNQNKFLFLAVLVFLLLSSFTNFFTSALLIVIVGSCLYIYANRVPPRSHHPKIRQVLENFAKIDPSYGEIPVSEGDSAYTESKRYIVLCLRDPKTGVEYDLNTLMYVALHELAHMITPMYEYDEKGNPNEHGPVFKKNFTHLLKTGRDLGFYNPAAPLPSSYCGVRNDE